MRGRVVVIDDEKNVGFVVKTILEKEGLEVVHYLDSEQAIASLPDEDCDVVVTDLYMPGPGGMEVLEACRKNLPRTPVILMTAFGTVESAVQALKAGAFDFVMKPFERTDLTRAVEQALKSAQESRREPELTDQSTLPTGVRPERAAIQSDEESFVLRGSSKSIAALRSESLKIAATDQPMEIIGDSGTGTEALARFIHDKSVRSTQPFIRVNFGILTEDQAEKELFGSIVPVARPGRLELADQGTIVLQNLVALHPRLQLKLAQALTDRSFPRPGTGDIIQIQFRIILLADRRLQDYANEGRIDRMLALVLSPFSVSTPKLADRIEDIEGLVAAFQARFVAKYGKSDKAWDREAMDALKRSDWPGNLTQLEKTVERAILVSDNDTIGLADLPEEIARLSQLRGDARLMEFGDPRLGFKEWVRIKTQEFERELITRALAETQGNVTKAAETLQLSRKGLQLKMRELGIKRAIDE